MKLLIFLVASLSAAAELTIPVPRAVKQVQGAGGLRIEVYEYGNPSGPPIVLVHGINQAHEAFLKQLEGPLAQRFRLIAPDLRGHGMSAWPNDERDYNEDRNWADDLNAVIVGLKLERPVLAGWSYGGRVIAKYLRFYGDSNVSAIKFIDTVLHTDDSGPQRGGALRGAGGPITSIGQMVERQRRFVGAFTFRALPREEFELLLGINMAVDPRAFRNQANVRFDYTEELKKITVPVLVTHGEQDQVSLLSNGQYIARTVPRARLSVYKDAGHLSFWEFPDRFAQELEDLAKARK